MDDTHPKPTVAQLDEQRKFVRRLIWFLLPLLLLAGVIEGLLWRSGETWTIEKVIRYQETHPGALFLRGRLDQGFYRYKFLGIQKQRPKILALGSSRVMQFRREMFGPRAGEFYNAGGMLQGVEDLRTYVDSLQPGTTPEVVILGVDLWWFNPGWPNKAGLAKGLTMDAASDWQEHVRAWREFKSQKGWKPAWQAMVATNDNVGVEGRSQNVGFRGDGSMRYNHPLPQSAEEWKFVDREKPPIPARIRTGSGQFVAATGLAGERLQVLDDCLKKLSAKGVLVLGFLPPFSSESSSLLASTPSQAALWQEFRTKIPEVFARYRLPLVDASKPADLGLDDTYLIDGIHGAETFQLEVLRQFLKSEAAKKRLGDLEKPIAAALRSRETNPWEPDYSALTNAR